MNAQELLAKIETNAVKVAKSKKGPSMRMARTMEVGGPAIRQGDIYVWRIDGVPNGATAREDRQLALGNTKGSRHVALPGPKLYDLPLNKRHMLLGPVVKAPARWEITHPEHAHYSLPSGVYQVGYQLDQRTRQAVAD